MSSVFLTLRRPRFILISGLVIITLALFSPLYNYSKSLSFNEPPPLDAPSTANASASAEPTRPNGVIVMLVPPSRIHQATLTLRNVEARFNRRLKYPYVLFMVEGEYERVPETQKQRIEYVTEGRATFAIIPKSQWGVPEGLDMELVEASIKNIGFTINYRSMCRWYSGFFWQHPALKSYDWLWRLDTDIEFHCDVPYDPIARIIENKGLYGFVQVTEDGDWVQPTLASNVSAFLATVDVEDLHHDLKRKRRRNPALTFPEDANHWFMWLGNDGVAKALRGDAGNHEWTKKTMYNNFEISHRSIWENDLYTSFFEYLDKTGGFFYERWGDAPVHSYGIAMSLRKDQAVLLKDTGYQHQGWPYKCPAQSPLCTCLGEGKKENHPEGDDAWYKPFI